MVFWYIYLTLIWFVTVNIVVYLFHMVFQSSTMFAVVTFSWEQNEAKRGRFILVEMKDIIGRQENEKAKHFGALAKTHNSENFNQAAKPNNIYQTIEWDDIS